MWMSRLVLVFVMLSTVLLAADGYAGKVQRLAGRITLKITSAVPAGGGFGFTWAKGTLTLIDGTEHVFSVSGLGIRGNEGSIFDLEAKGEVYNLTMIEDFAGTYRRTMGELSPERGMNTLIIKNERDVHIVVTVQFAKESGDAHLTPSESGVTVKLER
ncbi:MAG TPA: hypothetical protein VLK82_27360 [Candidatus Tectomicrobia bacterium]|nr:hypothetical protein [Candidatus Tectomicrobia bacterium]